MPNVVARWVDHADAQDSVATDLFYSEDKRPLKNDRDVTVEHALVHNDYPNNPHKVYGYLRTAEFARVLSAFLQARDIINGASRGVVAAAAPAFVYSGPSAAVQSYATAQPAVYAPTASYARSGAFYYPRSAAFGQPQQQQQYYY